MTTASAEQSIPGFLVADVERNAGTLTGSLRRAWSKFQAYRATLAELRDLTDRQLNDAGMSRDGIEPTAHRAVYGI